MAIVGSRIHRQNNLGPPHKTLGIGLAFAIVGSHDIISLLSEYFCQTPLGLPRHAIGRVAGIGEKVRFWIYGRIPPFRSSTDHTFVFQASHLKALLMEAGCDDVRTKGYCYVPNGESFHWKLYKGFCRTLDQIVGHGEYLMAVGRRAPKRNHR